MIWEINQFFIADSTASRGDHKDNYDKINVDLVNAIYYILLNSVYCMFILYVHCTFGDIRNEFAIVINE